MLDVVNAVHIIYDEKILGELIVVIFLYLFLCFFTLAFVKI